MARILVIDDDRAVGATVRTQLAKAGHTVFVSDDSRRALDRLEREEFDLLIVDIFMPGMDGLETISQVQKLKPLLPVIVMSGHEFRTGTGTAPDFLGMALKLGAVRTLRKPFKAGELLAGVDAALRDR